MDKANESCIDVVAFEMGHDLFVEATAVAAFEITEFHDGEWRAGVPQRRFPLQQQGAGERGDRSSLGLAGLGQTLVQKPLDHDRAPSAKGYACQKSDHNAMRNLHRGSADAMNAVMLMALARRSRLNGSSGSWE